MHKIGSEIQSYLINVFYFQNDNWMVLIEYNIQHVEVMLYASIEDLSQYLNVFQIRHANKNH